MVTTQVQIETIECPRCQGRFPRPRQAATATCSHCGASVTLTDEIMDQTLVFAGEVLTRGKIVVAPAGKVKANLSATEIQILGTVEGNVSAVEKLIIGAAATLRGVCRARKLAVAEGAKIAGRLEIGESEKPIAKSPH